MEINKSIDQIIAASSYLQKVEKAKGLPPGTIRQHKDGFRYEKQADGSWKELRRSSKHGPRQQPDHKEPKAKPMDPAHEAEDIQDHFAGYDVGRNHDKPTLKPLPKGGWRGRLQEQYDSFEDWQDYASKYGKHEQLGYKNPKAAWDANPTIQGGDRPEDFKISKSEGKGRFHFNTNSTDDGKSWGVKELTSEIKKQLAAKSMPKIPETPTPVAKQPKTPGIPVGTSELEKACGEDIGQTHGTVNGKPTNEVVKAIVREVMKASLPPGTIRTHADGYKYQKQADGSWKEVRKPGARHEEQAKPNAKFGEPNKAQANELHAFADNHGDLYRQMIEPIQRNLEKKIKSGAYDPDLADKAYFRVMQEAAKLYEKDNPPMPGISTFSKNDMYAAAQKMRKLFEEENKAQGGNMYGKQNPDWKPTKYIKDGKEIEEQNPGDAGKHALETYHSYSKHQHKATPFKTKKTMMPAGPTQGLQ